MDLELLHHAIQLRDSGEVQSALNIFQLLADTSNDVEDRVSLLLNMVSCYELAGDLSKARHFLEHAKCMLPETSGLTMDVDFEEAALAMRQGNRANALMLFERLLHKYEKEFTAAELAPVKANVIARMGILEVNLGHPRRALPLLQLAKSAGVEPGKMSYYIGCSQFDLGDFVRAEEALSQAIDDPPDAKILLLARYHLAVTHARTGALVQAKLELEQCAEAARQFDLQKQVYGALAEVSRGLGEIALAEHYDSLASNVG